MPVKNWSISTTVRNPDRIRGFLAILREFEGQLFNTETQKDYQKKLIENRLYKPSNLPQNLLNYYSNPESPIPQDDLEAIFSRVARPDLRGRTSVSPLNHMGFAIAKQAVGPVKITALGKELLKEEADLEEIFFRHFIKWQFPNPINKKFTRRAGFNIKPFIATLHVINNVNSLWEGLGKEPVGISKEEFAIFIPTLINHQNINQVSQDLIDFRNNLRKRSGGEQQRFKESFIKRRITRIYNLRSQEDIERQWSNLRDYADSIIRYFRLTGYLYIRGEGRYVDLSPQRELETNKLLQTFSGKADEFRGTEELSPEEQYQVFLSDPYRPILPWENQNDLLIIAKDIFADVQSLENEIDRSYHAIKFSKCPKDILDSESESELRKRIKFLRKQRLILLDLINHEETQHPDKLNEYIDKLESLLGRRSFVGENRPLMFEWYATLSLRSLNDALEIKPNYPVGDDNIPVFVAPARKADIECRYSAFVIGTEVTLLRNRSQWIQEGQPVQRHIRDLENKYSEKPVYGLFIAPSIHRDTKNTFWIANKYEYEGRPSKIIPLSLPQYIKILKLVLKRKRESKEKFTYEELQDLLKNLSGLVTQVSNSEEWLNHFDEEIQKWGEKVTSL